MDFLTQKFIASANRLNNIIRGVSEKLDALERKVADLSDGLKDAKESIDKHRQSSEQRKNTEPISISDFRSNVPIRVDTHSNKTKPEWSWVFLKGTLEVGVAVAVIGYTIVAYFNWQESIDATNFAGIQAKFTRQTFNESVKNFRLDERAWVGEEESPFSIKPIDGGYHVEAAVRFMNNGKTPALKVKSSAILEYSQHGPLNISAASEQFEKRGTTSPASFTSVPPGEKLVVDLTVDHATLNREGVQAIEGGKVLVYIFGRVTYEDIFHHSHFTHACLKYDYVFHHLADCESYNDSN